jgi:uncharacterized protein DUF993
MPTIALPTTKGTLVPFATSAPRQFAHATPPFPRVVYAAAHMVIDPLAEQDPWVEPVIDWKRTIAFRRYLWSLGLGVAEAMDTAQRGMGLDWAGAKNLIRHSLDAMRDVPGALMASGAGTDHLEPGPDVSVDDVIRAYEEQCEAIESMGGRIILMASRALAKAARSPADYERVYARVLSQVKQPVIIHWLGEMFDPALEGLRPHGSDGDRAFRHPRQRPQGGWGKDLAVRCQEGGRDAAPSAARRAHVHRGRFQLPRADRR